MVSVFTCGLIPMLFGGLDSTEGIIMFSVLADQICVCSVECLCPLL